MYTKKSEARHENDSAALIQAQDFRINLDVAERNGMRLIGPLDPSPAALDLHTDVVMGYSAGPSCAEPGVGSFAGCRNASDKLALHRPGKLRFSFVLPSYACVPSVSPYHKLKPERKIPG